MNQIVPYPLWVGHAREGQDYRRVFDAGIQAAVELAAEEPASQPPRELIYCRFPLVDGPGNDPKLLYLAINTLANLLERQVPTLVGCGGGMSRSPAVAAAAMAMVYQEAPEECLQRVKQHHPTDVTPGFWEDVKGFLESVRY